MSVQNKTNISFYFILFKSVKLLVYIYIYIYAINILLGHTLFFFYIVKFYVWLHTYYMFSYV